MLQPLRIVYSSLCVARIVSVADFKHLNLQLSSKTLYEKRSEYYHYSAAQLQWMKADRKVVDLSLSIKAPTFVVPCSVTERDLPVLVLDIGTAQIHSDLHESTSQLSSGELAALEAVHRASSLVLGSSCHSIPSLIFHTICCNTASSCSLFAVFSQLQKLVSNHFYVFPDVFP